MKNKKILIILFVICCLVISGCDNKKVYYGLKKLDPYLYEINYNDYRYDTNFETVTNIEDFACSSVKNGNYYGRNFDFIYNDVPEFIIKVNATKERNASIGVAFLSSIHESSDMEKEYGAKLDLIPNLTLDGINDKGVIASINVVPSTDVIEVTGTNPNGEDLHMSFMVRYILDNAISAQNAVDLLSNRNIYGSMGEHYNLHIMIADKDKTFIVEFIDNKMVAEEKTDSDQIMTNFYNNLDYFTENSAGLERYNILKEHYEEGSTFDGMWNLLKRVRYSNAYLKDSHWYSEFLPQSVLTSENVDDYSDLYNELVADYWFTLARGIRTPANENYWFTTHNSIYDIENLKLRLTIQEDYNNYYEYELK